MLAFMHIRTHAHTHTGVVCVCVSVASFAAMWQHHFVLKSELVLDGRRVQVHATELFR